MKKNLKLVIFDMDGLLFDTERPSYKAMNRSMKAYGFDFSLDIYKRMIGINDQASKNIIKEVWGSNNPIEQIFKRYDREFKNILETEGITVKAGALKLLDWLDEKILKNVLPLQVVEIQLQTTYQWRD